MVEKDSVSWSIMISGLAKFGDHLNSFRTFRELIRSRTTPLDNFTLPMVIRSCRACSDLRAGGAVHGVAWKNGFNSDRFVYAALVDLYAKCGASETARKLFDEMPQRDLVTWTVMICSYAEKENAGEALDLFDQMRKDGIMPDRIAMVAAVNACAKFGALNKAREVHDYLIQNNFSINTILGTAMVDMYAKCGSVGAAREIFDSMNDKNVITWSAMIAAYAYHGEGSKALDLFTEMLISGIRPNEITFMWLLYACSHSGLVEDGLWVFSKMQEAYNVQPNVKHYTCVVDIFGRAGRLDEALKLIEEMDVEKDQGLWGALLGACRIHKKIELAEKAAEALLEMESDNPGHYVLLSNIYANAGRWEEMAQVRHLMTQRKLKKLPGWTWIEVEEKVHRFGAGDRSHPRADEIYSMLDRLQERLELAGYVPDTDFVLHDVEEEVKVGILSTHSEKIAIAFGLLMTPEGSSIRIRKNLRVCGDCHTFCKFVSTVAAREIIVRDSSRFHHFTEGSCSCGDYW